MTIHTLTSFAQTFEQLPATLPIFPLPNALLIPGGQLPLNIFEDKYLDMVTDTMRNDSLIGMIQPKPTPTNVHEVNRPQLYEVGCAGRITDYSETHDGRFEIILSGLCRFAINEELDSVRDYRVIRPEWAPFKQDYTPYKEPPSNVLIEFMTVLKGFLIGHDMPADWDIFEKLSTNSLVSSLMNVLPIQTSERQILLEADTLESRVRMFTAILAGTVSNSQARH